MKTITPLKKSMTFLSVAMMLVAVFAFAPTPANAVEISYEEIDGIVYVGVLCDNGLEGRGTFLSRAAARSAAIEYCNNFG